MCYDAIFCQRHRFVYTDVKAAKLLILPAGFSTRVPCYVGASYCAFFSCKTKGVTKISIANKETYKFDYGHCGDVTAILHNFLQQKHMLRIKHGSPINLKPPE